MLNTKESPDKAGRIFPPVVEVEYGEVTLKDLEEGKKMDFEFSVSIVLCRLSCSRGFFSLYYFSGL